jgi:hypothetical protein
MTPIEKLMTRIAYDLERGEVLYSAEYSAGREEGGPFIYIETADHDLFTLSIAPGAPE